MKLLYDPPIPLLGIYPSKIENRDPNRYYVHAMDMYTHVHSSIIHSSQKWKQSKCPSTDERMNKRWYTHLTE